MVGANMAGISYASAERMVATGEVIFLDEPCPQRVEPLLHMSMVKLKGGVPMHPKNICNEKPETKTQMSWNHT